MIEELALDNISVFNLDELCDREDFERVRQDLLEEYGEPLEALKDRVWRGGQGSLCREDQDALRMFCGITRFLFEDALHPGQTRSRTALQKESRQKAYDVMRRSGAWTALIAKRFPAAVRLSIHPQACGAGKLGIRLLGDDSWMTPWHGVAVDTGERFELMKRWEAERLGATLVQDPVGRPSHFRLMAPRTGTGGAS